MHSHMVYYTENELFLVCFFKKKLMSSWYIQPTKDYLPTLLIESIDSCRRHHQHPFVFFLKDLFSQEYDLVLGHSRTFIDF